MSNAGSEPYRSGDTMIAATINDSMVKHTQHILRLFD